MLYRYKTSSSNMGNCGNTQRYASSSNSPSDADSQQLTDGRCLHQGSILGLGYAEGQLYTCSDDKSIGKLSVDKLCRDKHYEGVYFKGHEKAVNRLVMSAKNRLWSASRDLSVRLVRTFMNTSSFIERSFTITSIYTLII